MAAGLTAAAGPVVVAPAQRYQPRLIAPRGAGLTGVAYLLEDDTNNIREAVWTGKDGTTVSLGRVESESRLWPSVQGADVVAWPRGDGPISSVDLVEIATGSTTPRSPYRATGTSPRSGTTVVTIKSDGPNMGSGKIHLLRLDGDETTDVEVAGITVSANSASYPWSGDATTMLIQRDRTLTLIDLATGTWADVAEHPLIWSNLVLKLTPTQGAVVQHDR